VRNVFKVACAVFFLFIPFAFSVAADRVEDADAAYRRGDFSTALRLFRPLADQGNSFAQTALGFMNAEGQGVQKDFSEAAKWFRKGAEQGSADAQYNLGIMYAKGQGVAQDYPEAIKWFHRAADQGNAPAQYNLGLMYYKGQGVAQDYSEAINWYRKAADQGDADAQTRLGTAIKLEWINRTLLPVIQTIFIPTAIAVFVVMLSTAFFQRTREFSSIIGLIASVAFGVVLWFESAVIVFNWWG
jgi:uncharacterized protein